MENFHPLRRTPLHANALNSAHRCAETGAWLRRTWRKRNCAEFNIAKNVLIIAILPYQPAFAVLSWHMEWNAQLYPSLGYSHRNASTNPSWFDESGRASDVTASVLIFIGIFNTIYTRTAHMTTPAKPINHVRYKAFHHHRRQMQIKTMRKSRFIKELHSG